MKSVLGTVAGGGEKFDLDNEVARRTGYYSSSPGSMANRVVCNAVWNRVWLRLVLVMKEQARGNRK